jgi:L-lactate permease
MRRQPLIDVPPWALPVAVLAVATPILVAMVTLGPFFGLLIGGVVGAAVVVTAIRLATEPGRSATRRRDPDYATLPGGDSLKEASEVPAERARELAD